MISDKTYILQQNTNICRYHLATKRTTKTTTNNKHKQIRTFLTSSTRASRVATLTFQPYRSPNTRISGPAMSITTLPVESVFDDERWMTSIRTRAASSFSSGDPDMRPSLSMVRHGVMPCVMGREEGGRKKDGSVWGRRRERDGWDEGEWEKERWECGFLPFLTFSSSPSLFPLVTSPFPYFLLLLLPFPCHSHSLPSAHSHLQ